ncbi:hypothetical protein, variant [Aphanomyces invadans]|uniref:DUF5880 domain-containing protein n=1 Tax=Aphanomyces invadans TaxID=157072 RepID=A0A024TIH6_9STRA|nr:hypothetical protein, variant [Aphanomyces invadans]ETV93162.1 hypothetical protein, variant [Aphanomyces invadans]|eukprot:XP_008878183.1 hypothetical protein, variant [Aphanomyces invadans]
MANAKKRAADPAADASSKKTKADLLQGVNIQAIMNAEGPVVQCVLLKADGTMEQVTVDMTPQKQEVKALLGGACHFLGQYEDIEVFLMCNPDAQDDDSVPVTKQKMQPPFHGRLGEIRGDILIFRTDASGEQQDFTVDEYKSFLALDLPEWEPEEDDDDDTEADDDDEAYKKAALAYLVEEFTEENGREPTEAERHDIEAKVEAEMADSSDHPDASEAALQFFVAQFVEEHGTGIVDTARRLAS